MRSTASAALASVALFAPLFLTARAGAVISDPNNPPHQSENGQYGYNDCAGKPDSAESNCQTSYINSLDDFCLFAPPKRTDIGSAERYVVSWCTAKGHGARLIPAGALKGAHFVKTDKYIQITGRGDLTKLNIPRGDDGGELDPHGADGNGNPIGGLLLGNHDGKLVQYTEWTQFISDKQFCIRACFGKDAATWCEHIYDVMGCDWNMPANYDEGRFETCDADKPAEPMGIYRKKDGSLSTWHQGQNPTPAAQPVPRSSNCQAVQTIAGQPYRKKRAIA